MQGNIEQRASTGKHELEEPGEANLKAGVSDRARGTRVERDKITVIASEICINRIKVLLEFEVYNLRLAAGLFVDDETVESGNSGNFPENQSHDVSLLLSRFPVPACRSSGVKSEVLLLVFSAVLSEFVVWFL